VEPKITGETPSRDSLHCPDVSPNAESPPAIHDYALIGNCRTVALVSNRGSIDWLCAPRFDSPSLFAALLDPEQGGCFQVAPRDIRKITRRYLSRTNVLQTTFETSSGVVELTDFMPVASERRQCVEFWAEHEILRRVRCRKGRATLEMLCRPSPAYGRTRARVRACRGIGVSFDAGGHTVMVRTASALSCDEQRGEARASFDLGEGEEKWIGVTISRESPSILPPLGEQARARLRSTITWWRQWADRCAYNGPAQQSVLRSALALKLLFFAPSGAIVAAPTTSLPEQIGGVRNWDYRYCWLRDSSLTLRALRSLGFREEGESFLNWLLHATRLTWPELNIMYDVYGRTRLHERELDHLAGYRGSRPVRVGNDAADQLQLDTYGALVDAVAQIVHDAERVDRSSRRALVGFGKTACRRWEQPDEGIWEVRGGRRHHTVSKAMCWVALDRLCRLHKEGVIKAPLEQFRKNRDLIRGRIDAEGVGNDGAYVAELGGASMDASLLLLAIYGYEDPKSERMRRTVDRVYAELGEGSLLHRYRDVEDGLPAGEGTFGICSFWGVEALAMQGRIEEAREHFENLCAHSNDVGLYAEEFDSETGEALGNFPQGFTHVGLINAAVAIARATSKVEVASTP